MYPRSNLGRRVGLAAMTLIAVLACELTPPFIYNSYGAYVAPMTLLALLGVERIVTRVHGVRGGLLVGIAAVAVTPACCIIARWELMREHHLWKGTSDAEDGLVMVVFGVGILGGIVASASLADKPGSPQIRTSMICLYASGLLAFALAFLFGAEWSPFMISYLHADMALLGALIAIALGVDAWRKERFHTLAATGQPGQHKGDGWIELEDGQAPVHHPALAGSEPGPVIVQTDHRRVGGGGYRDGAAMQIRVVAGTAGEIRARGHEISASRLAMGAAVVLLASLMLLALATLSIAPLGSRR